MMPMTPRGTRTCVMRIPFGRVHSVIVSPTGSGRSATCSTPAAIASMRAWVSVRRSTNAAAAPSARAAATSSALAARSCASRARNAAAPERSAAFFAAVDVPARIGAAARAARHRETTRDSMLAASRLTSFMTPPGLFLYDHQVVAMDDLVAHLVAERRLDLTRVAALDLLQLGGAVVDEAARELAAVETDAEDAGADAEDAADLAQAGGQQAASLAGDRAARAVVDDQGSAGL